MKNRCIQLILAAFTIGIVIVSCSDNRLLQEADKHYSNYEFSLAAMQYENYLKEDTNKTVMLKLADCYRQMNRYQQSVMWYEKAIDAPEATKEDKLHYAQTLQAAGKKSEAIKYFDQYLADEPSDSVAINQRKYCDMEEINDPFYDVNVAPVVSNSSSFSPTLHNGMLYYSAEAPAKPGTPVNQWTGHGFLDIYCADPENLADAKEIDSVMINSDLHESNIVFTDNGNKAFFTRSAMKEVKSKRKTTHKVNAARDNTNHLEICSAELLDAKWTNVTALPFNSSEFSSGHPAFTATGNRMYFISDRPGGFGGTDLYYSDYSDGEWSAPMNAGPDVNTAGDEMFPTMRATTAQELMYFSSDGWGGFGGLDIFRSELINGLPTRPQHLPAPFNSHGDDFGLAFSEDARTGYFSSNRDSDNGDDRIYKFVRKDPRFFLNLTVLDKESQVPVPNTVVEITNVNTNAIWTSTTNAEGEILFPADSITQYGFKLNCDEYFCGFASASTGAFRGKFYDTTYAVATLDKIVIDKAVRLDNIYYDYNKWAIRPDAAVELDKLVALLQNNPQIKIELSSHTDSRGSDKYNQNLSQKRAQSAVDYIVSKGISKDRIKAKGYGESKLLNKCSSGIKCSEEEHQWNRRTEFKVIEIAK